MTTEANQGIPGRQAGNSNEVEVTPEMVARATDELWSLAEYLPQGWGLAPIVAGRVLAAGLGIALDRTGETEAA